MVIVVTKSFKINKLSLFPWGYEHVINFVFEA